MTLVIAEKCYGRVPSNEVELDFDNPENLHPKLRSAYYAACEVWEIFTGDEPDLEAELDDE
jgi:hypothetical protein